MATPTLLDVTQFWNARPCNVRHSPKELGTEEYFDEVEARKYRVEPHILPFADFDRWKGKRVLEVGCGIGTDSVSFARAGAKLMAVDLSSESIEIARKRFKVFGLSGEFREANAEELTKVIPVEPYDLVYSFGVIHHTPDPRKAVEELKQYLRPGSELRMMLYAKYSLKSFLIWLGLAQPEAQFGCPIAYTYSVRDIRKLLSGLEIISITKDHIFPYEISAYKEYRYVKAFPWNIMPRPLMRLIERLFGWHMLIRARLPTS